MGDETKLGVVGQCGYRRSVNSTLSDRGNGVDCQARMEWWGDVEHGHAYGLGGDFDTVEGKLFPSAKGPGSTLTNREAYYYFSMAQMARDIPNGPYTVGTQTTEEARLGGGTVSSNQDARDINGTMVTPEGDAGKFIGVERLQSFGVAFRPTAHWKIDVDAGFGTASRKLISGDREKLHFTALGIKYGVTLATGFGDNTTDVDSTWLLTTPTLVYGLYSLFGLGAIETDVQYEFLQQPVAATTNLLEGMTEKKSAIANPSTEDLPFLKSASLLTRTGASKLRLYARSLRLKQKPTLGGHVIFGAQIAESVGYSAAAAALWGAGANVLLGQGIAGANRSIVMGMLWSGARREKPWAEQLGVGAGLMALGYFVGKKSTLGGQALIEAGFETTLTGSREPDPMDDGFVTRGTYTGGVWSVGNRGARGYFGVRKALDLLDEHIEAAFSISSPALNLANATTRAANHTKDDNEEPLPDTTAPSTVRSEVNFLWHSNYDAPISFDISGGLHLATQFTMTDVHAGVGLQVSAEIGIRCTDNWRINLGAHAYGTITDDGNEAEFVPTGGMSNRF